MKGMFYSFVIITALASLASCHQAKQSTGSASIVGTHWQLIEVNGEAVLPDEQLKRGPHMILNASENSVNGNGGCNSFFGSYELQGDNGITFTNIGSTKMACQNDAMQIERQLIQAFEMANKFTIRNDTLILTKTDMSPLATFIVSDMK
ncbi:META domain-containing protein [Cesiribacter sp. SM1]|uniref:META domain-containing protein n=1 Tax=Cesiribacter sp. SM1 TaxID=2861196 RepID=UPI001CD74373|nr:META domain-containing protein [Cesiribacter sp. SM1]